MLVLSSVIFCEPVSLLILFPFVIFMVCTSVYTCPTRNAEVSTIKVRDFHIAQDEKEIGYYVGYIASSFSFAQMCSGTVALER
jgi:hypothetical protein